MCEVRPKPPIQGFRDLGPVHVVDGGVVQLKRPLALGFEWSTRLDRHPKLLHVASSQQE